MHPLPPAQLAEWFRQYAARLVLYARQWLPAELAEDVVQDVFVQMMAKDHVPRHPQAWLYRAVRNRAIDGLRSRTHRRQRERAVAEQRPDYFTLSLANRLDAHEVQRVLEGLHGEQREVIVLRLWGGLTLEETAHVVGCSTATAHRRYHAGLTTIRKQLESASCAIPDILTK